LLFTDADVRWQPGALAALLDEFQRTQADLLTIWPTQITHTWPERLVVPLMALTIVGYLPVLATHHLPGRAFAAAMGQCLLFRRTAYDHIGGHAAVRGKIVEDMAFAHTLKGAGLRLRVADGAGMIATRMYHNWAQVRAGFAKNILAGHGGYLALALSTIFHWGVFLLPWGWLLLGAWLPSREAWPLWPLTLCALGVGLRALTAAVTRQRVADSLLLPVSVLLMTIIAAQSALWQGRGGPQWKGRQVTK
jgi:chlorobactene glucosyltransferase